MRTIGRLGKKGPRHCCPGHIHPGGKEKLKSSPDMDCPGHFISGGEEIFKTAWAMLARAVLTPEVMWKLVSSIHLFQYHTLWPTDECIGGG